VARACAFRPDNGRKFPHRNDGEHAPCRSRQKPIWTKASKSSAEFVSTARQIEIAENIDQWHGPDYRYFKVRGSDGNLYMLRHNEIRATWELTMYELVLAFKLAFYV
jgi:hypothetical protein